MIGYCCKYMDYDFLSFIMGCFERNLPLVEKLFHAEIYRGIAGCREYVECIQWFDAYGGLSRDTIARTLRCMDAEYRGWPFTELSTECGREIMDIFCVSIDKH